MLRNYCPLHLSLCFAGAVICLLMMATEGLAQPVPLGPQPSPTPVEVEIKSATAKRITGADNLVKAWQVIIEFSKGFDANSGSTDSIHVHDSSNYKLVNTSNATQLRASISDFALITGTSVTNHVKLTLSPGDELNSDDVFYIFTPNLVFNGVRAKSVPIHKIDVTEEVIKAEPPDVPRPAWKLNSSKGRNDSDLYGSYQLTAARGQATTGSGDLKVAIPFFATFWHRTSRFSPLVDMKISSDEKADPDSMKFALEWFLPLHVGENPDAHFPYTAVDLINSGKIEAPKNFNNINAVWESKWLFPSSHFGICKRVRCFLDPFVGHELGKNLRSPLKSAQGKGLFRLMVGADLTIQIPIKGPSALKGFEFDSSFVRRWPIKRELLVDKDANGNLLGLFLSKGPKDYSDSKFAIKINDYFGPYIGYEWGRLPPNYELVDHKWTFGILFKSKVRAGGE
jgi:hypothetical protein